MKFIITELILYAKVAVAAFAGIYAAKNEEKIKDWIKSKIAAISGSKKI